MTSPARKFLVFDVALQVLALLAMIGGTLLALLMPATADEDENILYALLAILALVGVLMWQLLSIGIRWVLLKERTPSLRNWLLLLLTSILVDVLLVALLVEAGLSKDLLVLARMGVVLAVLPPIVFCIQTGLRLRHMQPEDQAPR